MTKIEDTSVSSKLKPANVDIDYNILVAAALDEELSLFLNREKNEKHWDYVDENNLIKSYRVSDVYGNVHHILCYSPDHMGMAYNAVGLTKIIEKYNPKFVLFIGTCADLSGETGANFKKFINRSIKFLQSLIQSKDQVDVKNKSLDLKEGNVLIPKYIFDYGSGKHNGDKFQHEFRPYNVSESLVALANDMLRRKNRSYDFKVDSSCGFCTGSAVVNSKKVRKKIKIIANRKVRGLDMEGYVIAVINHICKTEAIVIKGIMDFGSGKTDEYKNAAIENSAKVADDLIAEIVITQRI